MGLRLEDGKGRGFEVAIESDNHLQTDSVVQTKVEHLSEEKGDSYMWASGSYDPMVGNDTILLVQNTSDTQNLHINRIWLSTAVDTRVTIHLVTVALTPAGTAIVGTNMNTNSSRVAAAIAKRDETNNSIGSIIWSGEIYALSGPYEVVIAGAVILGKNKSIGVDYVVDPTACDVTIMGYYD